MQTSTKKYFAMKKINMDQLSEEEKENPMHEVNVLKGLTHPNIVQYHDTIEKDGEL